MGGSDIDELVDGLEGWKQQCCRSVVHAVREMPEAIDESIKWGNPHFDRRGAVLKIYCAKRWVNIIFYRGNHLSDPREMFEKTSNVRMRTIKVLADRPLDVEGLRELLKDAVLVDDQAA